MSQTPRNIGKKARFIFLALVLWPGQANKS